MLHAHTLTHTQKGEFWLHLDDNIWAEILLIEWASFPYIEKKRSKRRKEQGGSVEFWPLVCACVLSHFSCVWLFATLWTVAHQDPLMSVGFSRQEYWSGLPYPPPGDLSHPGIEPTLPLTPAVQADSLATELPGQPLLMHTQLLFSISFAPFLSSTRPYNVWSLLLHLWFSLLYSVTTLFIPSPICSWFPHQQFHPDIQTQMEYCLQTSPTIMKLYVQHWLNMSNFQLLLSASHQTCVFFSCFMTLLSPDHFNRHWPTVHQYPSSIPSCHMARLHFLAPLRFSGLPRRR